MRAGAFHQTVVSGLRFEGVPSGDGPYLSATVAASGQPAGGVALGVSRVRRFQPEPYGRRSAPLGWWIVKYTDEARVFLDGFTPGDVERLRAEFGLAPIEGRAASDDSVAGFYRSRAWAGLVRWVGEHPRAAKRVARFDAYLPGWYDLARASLAGPMPRAQPTGPLH